MSTWPYRKAKGLKHTRLKCTRVDTKNLQVLSFETPNLLTFQIMLVHMTESAIVFALAWFQAIACEWVHYDSTARWPAWENWSRCPCYSPSVLWPREVSAVSLAVVRFSSATVSDRHDTAGSETWWKFSVRKRLDYPSFIPDLAASHFNLFRAWRNICQDIAALTTKTSNLLPSRQWRNRDVRSVSPGRTNIPLVVTRTSTLKGTPSKYRGADRSLARPGRKQATATEDFEFHISYL